MLYDKTVFFLIRAADFVLQLLLSKIIVYILYLLDPSVNDAAKIIRLLQIHNLRKLQTRINQAIVAVQKLSANPKTDQSLGKVGR